MPDGVINLFKPVGSTSAQWTYKLRPLLRERRLGHAGSLDPFAEGVLLVCAGKATRQVERLMELTKVYEAGLTLGVTNESFDPEQPLRPVAGARMPAAKEVAATLREFTGLIEQVPPAFSAVKVGGRVSHRLARRGRPVELKARPVRIDAIELLEYAAPMVRLRVTCGRGTYLRALARDLGAAWGCGAVCTTLARRRIGPFEMEASVRLDCASREEIDAALRPWDEVEAMIPAAGAVS